MRRVLATSVVVLALLSSSIAHAGGGKWWTFKDPAGRFSLVLPPQWHVREDIASGHALGLSADPGRVLTLDLLPTKEKLVSSYLKRIDAENAHAWEGDPSVDVQSTKYTKIGSLNAIVRQEYLNAAGFSVVKLYTLKRANMYVFTLSPDVSEPLEGTAPTYIPKPRELIALLATFKFLK